jgi:deoxyhypusine synthase
MAEGGRYAEVYADATVVLPLLVKALFEELDKK